MGRASSEIVGSILISILLFVSCRKEKDTLPVPPVNAARKALVLCEGSLGNGNSSLGLYRADVDSFYEDVYKSANGQVIGDILQSAVLIGDKYFLCVNNSDKVVVVNRSDFKIAATISIPKPRYILPVSSAKAYVSTLFSNKVFIVDLQTLQSTGSITMPGLNPEGMVLRNDIAVICTWDTAVNKVYLVNTTSDMIAGEITLSGRAPQEALFDKEGMLWVLSGNVPKGKDAVLTRIDPADWHVVKSYFFPAGADAMRPVFNAAKDSLYFIEVNYSGGTTHNGIYRMGINAPSISTQPFIPAQQFQYFWALGIEPNTGNIYVGDPKGFTQKGAVTIYKPDGTVVKQFNTGVGPGHFFFDQ